MLQSVRTRPNKSKRLVVPLVRGDFGAPEAVYCFSTSKADMASAREKELERRVQELEVALAKANSGSSSNVVQREKITQVWSL